MKVKTKRQAKEISLRGTPICRGIAIGKPFSFSVAEDTVPTKSLAHKDIEKEITRYRRAITRSHQDLRILQERLEREGVHDGATILEAQQQMLRDPLLTTKIEIEICETCTNAEAVFYNTILQYQRKFNAMTDPFFRERSKDVQDICRRVMSYLRERVRISLSELPENSVVVARELTPSDVAEANSNRVAAFVTEADAETSHAAIVAKAKGIPYVTCIDFSKIEANHTSEIIVDGRNGSVILNPHPDTLSRYRALQEEMAIQFAQLGESSHLKAETYDGYEVYLSANIDVLTELDMLHQYGGNGVGLFRSECMFLTNETFPSEEEQFAVYQKIVEKMRGRPIVIRTFDVGGDKFLLNQEAPVEVNPFLGCRAIRFLLREQEIFKSQLRAILRASVFGNVSIMFPMISALSEVRQAKALVEEAKEELIASGIPVNKKIPIGCMIEVPSAAIVADLLAKECDFLSIGTNDLVQYSLAVDRGNHEVSGMYTPTDPSVIRLIKLIVSEASHRGVPVSVCGEVAADPRFTPLLLGLGVHELSVATRYIPIIKQAIRSTSIVEASKLADQALSLSTAEAIQALLV